MENIVSEIKHLNQAVARRVFEVHSEENMNCHPSPLQLDVISILLKREGEDVSLRDLQDELKISKAAVSDVIDKMEKKHIILKIPSTQDGRKMRVILLKEGKELFLSLEKNFKRINEEAVVGLTDDEINEFLFLSQKIIHNLRKED